MAGRQERLPGPGAIGNGNLNGTGSGMPLHPQLGNMAGISGMDLTGQAQGQHLPRMAVPMASNDPRLFASTTSLGYGSPGYSLDDEQQMQTPTTQQEDERPVKKKRKERIKLACDNCNKSKHSCDGQLPCSRCARGDKQCTYDRPGASTARTATPAATAGSPDDRAGGAAGTPRPSASAGTSSSSSAAAADALIAYLNAKISHLAGFISPRVPIGPAPYQTPHVTQQERLAVGTLYTQMSSIAPPYFQVVAELRNGEIVGGDPSTFPVNLHDLPRDGKPATLVVNGIEIDGFSAFAPVDAHGTHSYAGSVWIARAPNTSRGQQQPAQQLQTTQLQHQVQQPAVTSPSSWEFSQPYQYQQQQPILQQHQHQQHLPSFYSQASAIGSQYSQMQSASGMSLHGNNFYNPHPVPQLPTPGSEVKSSYDFLRNSGPGSAPSTANAGASPNTARALVSSSLHDALGVRVPSLTIPPSSPDHAPELRKTFRLLIPVIDANDAAALMEDAAGRCISANARFCSTFGIMGPPGSLVGQTDCGSRYVGSKTDDPAAFETATKTTLANRATTSGDGYEFRLKDGRIFQRDYVAVVSAGESGEYAGHIWLFRDVTLIRGWDQMSPPASAAPAASVTLNQPDLPSTPTPAPAQQAATLVEDENRRVILTNKAFTTLFNIPVPPDALIGSDCSNAASQAAPLFADPDTFVKRIEVLLREKKAVQGEKILMQDGRLLVRDYFPCWLEENYLGHVWMYNLVKQESARSH